MAYAGMYLRASEPMDANFNYYYNKHAAARQFMADIGCPDQNIYVNESNEKRPDTDSIGVTIASKDIYLYVEGGREKKTLIPIAVRGGGYEKEWASNATLDSATQTADRGKEAKGFSTAADQVESEIDLYIKKYGLEDEVSKGNVIFWISGYSRAGATSNLTAKRLVEKYADGTEAKKNKVFAYTCEAPMGGTDDAEKLKDKTPYYCIHNMVNAVDIVPMVAPQLMGFKRYGVDHYIPGTEAGLVDAADAYKEDLFVKHGKKKRGGENGPETVTTRKDNDAVYVKNIPAAKKNAMLTQLSAIDSGIVFDDYFHPMAMNFAPSVKFYENGNYAGNHIEEFVKDFLRFAQEGRKPHVVGDSTQAVPSRDDFSGNLQTALRDTLALVFTMDAENSAGFVGRLSSIMTKINTLSGDVNLLDLYTRVIMFWYTLSDSTKREYYDNLWKKIEETGAFEFLEEGEIKKLKDNWPALANMIFTLVSVDRQFLPAEWDECQGWAKGSNEKSMYMGTFITYANYILQNHYPEVNLAWARSYDSYYDNEKTEYEIVNDGYSVAAPVATANGKVLAEGENQSNRLTGAPRIILENENIVGEAIYYDLVNTKTGEKVAVNRLYRGGIDLDLGGARYADYRLTTYAVSYGVRSKQAVYNINLESGDHLVTIDDASDNSIQYFYFYPGDKVKAKADPADYKYFTRWWIRLKEGYNKTAEKDIAPILLGDHVNDSEIEFTMPAENAEYGNGKRYPENYTMSVMAYFEYRISTITVSPEEPVTGKNLQTETTVRLSPYIGNSFEPTDDEGNVIKYPITWTYIYEEDGESRVIPAGDTAYGSTKYLATITIPEDMAKIIVFCPQGKLSGKTFSGGYVDSVKKNEEDGSATITIKFSKTFPASTSDLPFGGDDTPTEPEGDRFTITYRLDGGSYAGSTDDIVEEYEAGVGITIHEAPEKEGYRFLYWEGSEFYPGDNYVVTGDHSFIAKWEKADENAPVNETEAASKTGGDAKKSGDSGGNTVVNKQTKAGTAKTGDTASPALWIILAVAAAAAVTVTAVAVGRRKKKEM